ncbi:hypothetical protein BDV93DRAFT_529718 [Ceratobasidium sp. AG-I]|nr:hypothetical protein BDV93DRAFT_529718 [Ceratobasidium sp. AG-I]
MLNALTRAHLPSRLLSLHPGCPIQQSCLFPLLPPLIALSKQQSASLSLRPLRPMAPPFQNSPGLLDVVRLRHVVILHLHVGLVSLGLTM